MLTYLIVPVLALLPTWLTRAATDGRPTRAAGERWRYSYIISVLALIVFAGGRVDVGTDYSLYETVFRQTEPHFRDYFLENSPQEWGFTVSVLGLRMLSDDPRILFMVSSIVTVGCAALAMRRMSANFAVSLTLYVLLGFYIAPFNILRQGLAISLNFLAYSYIDKHRGRFVALNVVAYLLHSSTLIAVVLQLALRRLKPSWRLFGILLLASALAAFLLAAFGSSLGFLSFFNERYLTYLQDQRSGVGTYLYMFSRAALVALLLVYRPRSGESDRYIVLSMMGVCLLLLGTQAVVISRLELYFSIYLLVALPSVVREIAPRSRVFVVSAVLLGSLAFYLAYLSQFGNLIPYEFDWSLIGLPGLGASR